jgi:flagellar protein FlaG
LGVFIVNISISGGSRSLLESAKAEQTKAQVKETANIQAPGEPEQADLVSVSEKSVIEAIEKANKVTLTHKTRAGFSVHEVTKDIMVKIVDTDSDEVIREFPPKKILDLIAKLWDLAGIVVDERR